MTAPYATNRGPLARPYGTPEDGPLTVAFTRAYGGGNPVRHLANADGTTRCGTAPRAPRAGYSRSGPAHPVYRYGATVGCEKCRKAAGQAPAGNADVVLRPGSLLSAKDQRTMRPAQQVQKLRRIARRALAHADWMNECATRMGYTGRELADCLDEAAASNAKAAKAVAEMVEVQGR